MKTSIVKGLIYGVVVIIAFLTLSLTIETNKSITRFNALMSVDVVKADMDPIRDAEDQYCIDPPEQIGCSYWRKHVCSTGVMCINPE